MERTVPWTEWLAFKHPLLIHVPVATAILLPLALLAAQRPGRGIRPWWLVCRYLGWAAVVMLMVSALSGLLMGRHAGVIPPGGWLAPKADAEGALLRTHQLLAGASLLLGLLYLRLAHRNRQDHQGFGVLPLLTGFAFAAALLWTGHQGTKLTRPVQVKTVVVREAGPAPATPAPAPARQASSPERILDFASLEPIQREPVKTTVHGLRWIRTWVTPSSAAAYRAGERLPAGTLVVLQSLEDRWGRPGSEPGPLYALEVQADGRGALSTYWGRIPEARRAEFGGAERVWWKPGDPNLEGCMGCHAEGTAPARDRSNVFPVRKPSPVPTPEG